MKKIYALPVALIMFTSCGTVNNLNSMIEESTTSIYLNREAIERSSEVIRQNAMIIEQSNQAIEENRKHLEALSKELK